MSEEEVILQIKEYEDNEDRYEGFEVVTSTRIVRLLIDNRQWGCERWGYLWCNDDPSSFIGAKLKEIEIVDEALDKHKVEDIIERLEEGKIMFINFVTRQGELQFVAYNAHNGYYGHKVKIEIDGKTICRWI